MKNVSPPLQGGVAYEVSFSADGKAVSIKDRAESFATSIVCFFMALAPVLDPYVLPFTSAGVRVNDFLVIIVVTYLLLSRKYSWNKRGVSLMLLATIFLFCTLLSVLEDVAGRDVRVALKIALFY